MRSLLPFRTFSAAVGLVALSSLFVMGQGCPPVNPPDDGGNDGGGGTPTGQFVGATECRICHSRLYDDWAATRHAGALDTLKAIGQDTNPQCIVCHTVGYGQEGGFVDEATTPQFAGVQCENCHGAGKEHRSNVSVASLRPPKPIDSETCGQCHNGFHHPTYDEWKSTKHGVVNEHTAESFENGTSLNSCGVCHSGDFRIRKLVWGEIVPDTLLAGVAPEDQNAITCVVCHDPHRQTGNDAIGELGHDWQLRYPEIQSPEAANTVAEASNPDRFNLCGQCHHSRGREWTSTSRGPHHSVQSNMYVGEMPVPDGITLLVPNERTVHRFVPKQCVTCHMVHHPFESEELPAHTGHDLAIDFSGCTTSGCHPSAESAEADMEALKSQVETRLAAIAARLGDPSTWEYSAEGGPSDQSTISDAVKKVRFMYSYILSDGSSGVHNPEYTRSLLSECEDLLTSEGL